jgi:hypothetical protein
LRRVILVNRNFKEGNTVAFKDKFKEAKEKATDLTEKAAEVRGVAADKLNAVLDDYSVAVETFESFGFKMTQFRVGMGLLPEINTSIRGSLKRVKEDEINELIEKNEGKKILIAMLRALLAAKDMQARAKLVNFGQLVLDVKLGIPPSISFNLEPE